MKSIYKKMIFTLGIITCVLPLFSCSHGDAADDDEIQIGIVVYDEYDTFISQMMEEFMQDVAAEIKQGKRISVSQYNAAGNQITQNNQVELVEEDLLSWDRLYYVGADAFESGAIEGEIVAEEYEKNPDIDKNKDGYIQYVVLEGEAGHQDAIVRSECSVNALIDAGIKVDKLESSVANWNRAQAQSKMMQLIEKYGDSIELVLSNNDDMALGAIDEYEARKISLKDRPVIVGIDGTNVGLKAVKEGSLLGTVYNDKEGQAESMFQLAIALATGEGLSDLPLVNGKYIRYPYTKVTRENIDSYLKEETE